LGLGQGGVLFTRSEIAAGLLVFSALHCGFCTSASCAFLRVSPQLPLLLALVLLLLAGCSGLVSAFVLSDCFCIV
jgi:hypothetical protein